MEQCISDQNSCCLQKEAEVKVINKKLQINKKENEKIKIKCSKKADKLSLIQEISIRDLREPKRQIKMLKKKRNIWKTSCWKYKETF